MKTRAFVLLLMGYGVCLGWSIVALVTHHGAFAPVGSLGASVLLVWTAVRYRHVLWRNR